MSGKKLNSYFTHTKQSGCSLVVKGEPAEATQVSSAPTERENFDTCDKQIFNMAKQHQPGGPENIPYSLILTVNYLG